MGFFDFFKQLNIDQGIEEYKRTAGAVLLDVRTPQEYQEGHIPESKNVPLQQLDNIISVAKNKDIPLYTNRGISLFFATETILSSCCNGTFLLPGICPS